jgi:hypothetical protein
MTNAIGTSPATPRPVPTEPPTLGGCPVGGDHAPIPVQGESYSVCAKCGAQC